MRMSAGTTAIKTSRIRRTRSPYLGDELRGDFSFCSVFTLGLHLAATWRAPRRLGYG
jgi:hypothetical protein